MNIKKWIWCILLILSFQSIVIASNQDSTDGIFEEIDVLYDNDVISGLSATYSIPKDFDEDRIIISPGVFKELSFLNKNYINHIPIKLIINNQSQYSYKIIDVLFEHLDYDDPNNRSNIYICYHQPSIYSIYSFLFSGECSIEHYESVLLSYLADYYLLKDVFYIDVLSKHYFIQELINHPELLSNSFHDDVLSFIISYQEEKMYDSLRDFGYNIYMEIVLKKEDESPPKTGI